MERLTTRDSDGTAITYEVDDICYYAVPVCQEIEIAGITMSRMDNFLKSIRGKVIDRLAQYEDTGLTPEEIHDLLHDTTGPLHKKLGQWIDAERQGRLVVLPEPTPDIDFMRIFNLIMADAEDRVIILPVKVNEEVFYLTPYAEEKIQALPVIQFIIDDKGLSFLAVNDAYGSNFTINDIGKRAFLTRKEAEAALKGDGAQ